MDSFSQYLLICFISQISDKATLLGSEQISGSTNVQILHGNMNTTSQITKVFNRLKTSSSFSCQTAQRRSQQITECFLVTTPYPSTHLMEITQAEVLRLIDNDGICIRNIDTTFDDCGCQEHVIVIVDKIQNNFLQFCRLHLSVSDCYTAIRNMALDHCFQFRQVRNPVIDEKDLPVAAHLKIDGIRYHFFIKSMHFGLNRIAVRRRSGNHAQITRAHQRKLKGTGNRSSSHCQCIYIHFQLTQLFFYGNSEFLFFVDNQQSQVFKLNILA